ncbi:hypothetical protein FSARC_10816 [Fusarium sarcochroum]|uniref:Zn(2)-C6 fungal-type domain-containing protein n=1 Tax=Fusarium sarcochroum TaxID=1208366 RepID=A0A8H4X2S6_9HYPO|nr:hypothetical protein FSARC_10816 [Fusarium sarcochroum]
MPQSNTTSPSAVDEGTSGGIKKPACDNCKSRKTRCDRGSPCSSCVVAELDCRLTRRPPEKRQRVLISNRYDEAMENVDRSLQQVTGALQKLLQINERSQSSPRSHGSPAASVSNNPPDVLGALEGYRGDSSFNAHVQRVTSALRDAATGLEGSLGDVPVNETLAATQMIEEAATSQVVTPGPTNTTPPAFPQLQYPELKDRPLPPLEHVLRILRLAQTEKQRFFVDVPIINEPDFGDLCQKVYFAVNDYSVLAWAVVNTGLLFLFNGLGKDHYGHIEVDDSDVHAYVQQLTANIEATLQSLRLCQEPSFEAIRAFGVLIHFCLKMGRNSVAWSLVAAASRMCIDLGWHRLPNHIDDAEMVVKRNLFWHIYIWDKGMAFTLGRSPSIHQYDVVTKRPTLPRDYPAAPAYLHAGFIEFSIITGEMYMQLFSAAAQLAPRETRNEKARAFATRIMNVNATLQKSLRETPYDVRETFKVINLYLDVITKCLTTIAYRVIPCDQTDASPLRCSFECVQAARQALSAIVQADEVFGEQNPDGWARFLNLLFNTVPFTSFIVLAGNTVASSSSEDLALLSAAVLAIKPIASSGPPGKKLFDVCKAFYQFASFSVARQVTESAAVYQQAIPTTTFTNPQVTAYEHIMVPQDWDTVMDEFELGDGAGDLASFMEPYMPFNWQMQ